MVATSQPSATHAGLRILESGGSAADAAIAASAVLCVTEPMSTSVAGDCFAIVADSSGEITGLDAAGPAPMSASPTAPIEQAGPTSVTVPGAVRGWAALSQRYGRLGLDACLSPAVDAARGGFAVSPMCAHYWNMAERAPRELGPPPKVGDVVRLSALGATIQLIADEGPDAFYTGRVGEAIAGVSWLEESDLAGYDARWVEPIRLTYNGLEVLELPPPNQGVVALETLGLFQRGEPTFLSLVECTRLALEDGLSRVRDGADVSDLLTAEYLDGRRDKVAAPVSEPGGGTVYLCAVDSDGLAVSFIQSCYEAFGSGIVAPGTGVTLQNRGACFSVSGAIEPGRRPYHTIIPGMLARDGEIVGPFGIMGAFIQAQRTRSSSIAWSITASTRRPRSMLRAFASTGARSTWSHRSGTGPASLPACRSRWSRSRRLAARRRPGDLSPGRRAGRWLRSA